jgi:hypothetical protein
VARGDAAFDEPITITRDGVVVDGYARLRLAEHRGRRELLCAVYGWTEEEALVQLISRHSRVEHLNDYVRIRLALELEPYFKAKARSNQQIGGQLKGSSKLTEAAKLDVRDKIANLAGVGPANVTKVKQLRGDADHDVLDALRSGEIRIDRAWKWSKLSHQEQRKKLEAFRERKGLPQTIRRLISRDLASRRQQPGDLPTASQETSLEQILSACLSFSAAERAAVVVRRVKISGKVLLISEDLLPKVREQAALKL